MDTHKVIVRGREIEFIQKPTEIEEGSKKKEVNYIQGH